MAVTRVITKTSQGANGATLTSTFTLSANEEVNLSQLVPANSTNQEYDMVFAHTNIQSVYILADQACTLKFNSSGSPAPQIALVASIPLEWDTTMYAQNSTSFPNPFTADVTKMFVTCTAATNLSISVLLTV